MRFSLLLVAVLFAFFTIANAQVNFSPAWGKRSSELLVADGPDSSDYRRGVGSEGCQTPLECLIRMQRLMKVRFPLVSIYLYLIIGLIWEWDYLSFTIRVFCVEQKEPPILDRMWNLEESLQWLISSHMGWSDTAHGIHPHHVSSS